VIRYPLVRRAAQIPVRGGGQSPWLSQAPDISSPETVPVNEISYSASTTPTVI